MSAPIVEVGRDYRVIHSRKGEFCVRITAASDEWVTGAIISGTAGALMHYNVKEEGEEVTMRATHCVFVDLPKAEAGAA